MPALFSLEENGMRNDSVNLCIGENALLEDALLKAIEIPQGL